MDVKRMSIQTSYRAQPMAGQENIDHYYLYLLKSNFRCRPRWLSSMRVRLETRRSRVQPQPRSATFFRGDWSWNIFYGHSLPLIQEGQLSVSGERMCLLLVNRLEDKACPVNVWLGKLTALNMTPLGWLGRKTSTQTNKLQVILTRNP